MNINQHFINFYLTPGVTRDNFIFEYCPKEFLIEALKHLSNQDGGIISCIVDLDQDEEALVQKTLSMFENESHKKMIARDYICSKILKTLLSISKEDKEVLQSLSSGVEAIKNGDKSTAINYHSVAPMPFDITSFYREKQKFELTFVLKNTKNSYLQQAINNFISSREPYSVKIFSTDRLSTYLDQANTYIECPHDYMSRKVQDFIEKPNEKD